MIKILSYRTRAPSPERSCLDNDPPTMSPQSHPVLLSLHVCPAQSLPWEPLYLWGQTDQWR